LASVREIEERKRLNERLTGVEQTLNLLTATVNELKVAFPQLEQMLQRLTDRIDAAREPAPSAPKRKKTNG